MNSVATDEVSAEKDVWQSLDKSIGETVEPAPAEGAASTSINTAPDVLLPSDFQLDAQLNHVAEDILDHQLGLDVVMNDSLESPSETDNEEDVTLESSPGISLPASDGMQDQPVVEGTNAELRIKVIKEIRKPGRSKFILQLLIKLNANV